MLRPDRQALAYFVAKPVRLSWMLLPLMGFECVMSERPLVPLEEGFVDTALVGEWHEQTSDPDGTDLVISVRDDGMMAVDLFFTEEGQDEDVRPFYTYRGYASRLGGDTYANLEFVDIGCQGCPPVEFAEARAEFLNDFAPIIADTDRGTCTFIVIKYEHTVDDRLIVYWQDNTAVKLAIERRQLAGRSLADDDGERPASRSAVGDGELAGRIFGADEGELAHQPCITASSASLAAWITGNTEAMFRPMDASEYVRQP